MLFDYKSMVISTARLPPGCLEKNMHFRFESTIIKSRSEAYFSQ